MKLHQFIFIILLILLGLQIVNGQEKPKAELVDELAPKFTDCDLSSRIYNLLNEVSEDNSKAVFVIYENEVNPTRKYIIEHWINYYLKLMKTSYEKSSIVFAVNNEKPNENFIRFYRLRQNSQIPQFTEISKDYKLSNLSKEQLLATSEAELFGLLFDNKLFVNLLKNNPNLVGKIVVYENNPKYRQKKIAEIFNELNRTHKIPRNQIQILYSKHSQEYPYESYSLVPKRRKL